MVNKVFNCNWIEFVKDVPDKFYDLTIADFGYGTGDVRRHGRGRKNSIHDKIDWNDEPPPDEWFIELYRISKHQIIWGCNYFGKNIIHPGRIVHYKNLTSWSKGKNLSECDLASQSFNNKIEYFEYRWSGNVQGNTINWKNTGQDKRIHPTQKPVFLYEWCLLKYANDRNWRLFDPTVGGGPFRKAAYNLGFDFFQGCEINKKYWGLQEEEFKNRISSGRILI